MTTCSLVCVEGEGAGARHDILDAVSMVQGDCRESLMAVRHQHVTAFILDNSLLLPIGTVAALIWANTAYGSYDTFAHSLHFAVNDIGMALFFAVAAKEIVQATAPGGALHPMRRATAPIVAAVGGMAVPAAVYLALVSAMGLPALAPGWAIPSATDIAFSFLVARLLFGAGHPAIPFLLLLAIADDALGLIVLALFYPAGAVRPFEFVLILSLAMGVCWVLRRRRVINFWPYILVGTISWLAFYRGGLHPSLALVPIVPFVPHAARDTGLFEEDPGEELDPLAQFEHATRVPVQAVLLLFGLANAGVPFSQIGPGTWIVTVALLAGKPIGIVAVTLAGHRLGLHLPSGVMWRDLIVVGCVAGIGFTVALFFCTATFPFGDLLDQTRMGALFSFTAAIVAAVAAFVLRVGRFRR
jgi:NhaA family Na+:H+ antiporter